MKHAAELVAFAGDLAKYGNVTAGFALAQALFLAYALGKNDDLTKSILKARVFVKNAVFMGNGAYGLAVLFFGFEEFRFRSAAHQPHMILQMTIAMVGARLLAILLAAIVPYLAIKWTFGNEHRKPTADSTGNVETDKA